MLEVIAKISILINSILKIHMFFKIFQDSEAMQNLSPRTSLITSSLCLWISEVHLFIHSSICPLSTVAYIVF